MPVRYTFSGSLFRMDLEGSYTPSDITESFLAALADPDFPDDPRFLFDVRRSAEMATRSKEDIISVARFLADHSEKVGGRCAVVATEPIQYGLSRMGAAFAEMRGAEVHVFTSFDEAVSWLGVASDIGAE